MPINRVEVWYRPGFEDPRGATLLREARELGLEGLEGVEAGEIFLLRGRPTGAAIRRVARLLLADPVTQFFLERRRRKPPGAVAVEIYFRPGVTDNTGETAREAVGRLPGVTGIESVSTGRRYFFRGPGVTPGAVEGLCPRLLANPLIEKWRVG